MPGSELGALDESSEVTDDWAPVGSVELTGTVDETGVVVCVGVTGGVVGGAGVVDVAPGVVGSALEDGVTLGVTGVVVGVDAAGVGFGSLGSEQLTTPDPSPSTQRSRNPSALRLIGALRLQRLAIGQITISTVRSRSV